MMIGSDRKYTSKWDLKEDSHFHPENIQGDVLRTKYGEPVSRNRSDEDYTNKTRSTTHSAVDGNYNMEMSSGLGDWRHRDQSSSPRNSWSRSPRSRSRSPVYGTGRHLKYNDKFISRSGLSSQLCKDFAAGRSKRDSFCRYRHDDNENHDSAEMKYKAHKYHTSRISGDHYSRNDRATEICNKFLRGTCLRGSSCKYVHDNAPHAYSRVSTDDMFRERERDKNRLNRYRTSEQHDGRGSGNVPCRYFAAGNCRNGRHCRFSHGQLSSSPDRRSGDHNWGPHHSMGAAEKVFEDSRWTYPSSVSGAVTSGENMKEKISDEKQKVTCWSIDEARDRSFYSENRSFADRNESNKIFGLSERNVLQLENNETGSRLAVPGPRGVGSLPVEIAMSPVWNYNIKPSTQSSKQELKTTNEDKVPVNSTVLATEKVASGEQLMKLGNLSASLAQLIANGQQLPEIYASLNSQISKDMPSFTNSNEAVMPLPPAASQSNRATELKLYNNPTSDIENLEQANIDNLRSKWTPEDHVFKSSDTVPNTKQLFPDNAPISEDEENNSNLQKDVRSESYIVSNNLNPPEGHANSKESREIDRMGAHESEKIQDDEKVTDSNPLENEGTVNKVEDGKKSKNMKELRIFKFALVEVVKELLKPAWKEGKIDKEVHKTIVKKSVDKVTTTLPEVNIPQTKDKIDAYLSSSRPKLTKLVEAYVEKFHKSKTRRETS